MKTIMNIENLSIMEMVSFLEGSQTVAFSVASTKDERYQFVDKVLKRYSYNSLKRFEKGTLIRFLEKVSGYSRQQLTRMIKRYTECGAVRRYQRTENGFNRIYQPEDLCLLAQLDQRHDTPNGLMVKKLCERAYHYFNEEGYERLANISVAHIYNLRKSSGYTKYRYHYEKTKSPKGVHIGERRKPQANGQPGYIRIDTVHQGDLDGRKGVYHINAVDEVTQFEVVISVERISEHYLIPVLEKLLETFPFKIINFHSDNGGEYVNKTVAKLLSKLLIEFTKSRPRHSNDNALAEGKNAAVVRKIFGYTHIPQRYAERINEFNQRALNPYVNYHRPCLYPTIEIDKKGKERKKYKYDDMMTPYEKLKMLPNAQQYLKEDVTFGLLDDIAHKMTDNEAADYLQQQRTLLFKHITEDTKQKALAS